MYLCTPAGPNSPHRALVESGQVGVMLTPMMGNAKTAPVWAADTGCFSAPDRFDLERYLAWLASRRGQGRCLFATAPDVVGDAAATWRAAEPALPRLRELGFRAALVLQNGQGGIPWTAVDAVFVGGDDAFKASSTVARIIEEARDRGVWTHMGRVNTETRWRQCVGMGFDSCDGTFLAFGPNANFPRLKKWLRIAENHHRLQERLAHLIAKSRET